MSSKHVVRYRFADESNLRQSRKRNLRSGLVVWFQRQTNQHLLRSKADCRKTTQWQKKQTKAATK